MKKLFIVVLLSMLPAFAEEEVFLDSGAVSQLNYGQLKYDNNRSNIDIDDDSIKPTFSNIKNMFEEDLYTKKTITNKKEKNFGKNTVGIKYDTTLNPNYADSKRTLYMKRNVSDKFSVDTSYNNNSAFSQNQVKGTVSVAPEYKFNSKSSIKNVNSRNMDNSSNKAEIMFNYKPFDDDRMDLNVGAGQTMYDNGNQSSSQVKFGTNFKF